MSVNIDFSGVEKFLELTALLEKDQEPTQKQWNDLFSTPGYQVLILREFNKDFFIDMPVVVDALYAYDQKDFLISFIAHEFHHYYRNQYFQYAQEQNFIWVIDQIQGEGIADQINKGKWFHDKNLYLKYAEKNRRYLEWYAKSPEIIREMDHLLAASYDHPEKKMEYGQDLQAIIPMSGHPTGFYMANLIIEQLGKETLVKDIGNPFAFFRLYKQAADKKGGETPTFSDKAIRFIQSLEERYVR